MAIAIVMHWPVARGRELFIDFPHADAPFGHGPTMGLQMHCLDRAGLVSVLSMGLQMYCLNRDRAVLVSVLGMGLQIYCLDRAV